MPKLFESPSRPRTRMGWPIVAGAFVAIVLGACEREPPKPRPLAELAEKAESDGVPFSAACQSWAIADFAKLAPPPKKPNEGRRRLDAIWRALIKNHLDPTLACIDWPRVHKAQVKRLGTSATAEAVDASFESVFGQLGPEAPRIEAERKARAPSPADDPRKQVAAGQARLQAFDAAGKALPSARPDKAQPEGESPTDAKKTKKRKKKKPEPLHVPPGMATAWWTLGSWTVRAVKQMEAALQELEDGESVATIVDLRDTSGNAIRSAIRLLGACTDRNRMIGEVSDRKGTRELKIRRTEGHRLGRSMLVLTSEGSSTASQFFAYSAVVECGASWWYEYEGDTPEETPAKARRPIWSESPHALPGGGELWVRNSLLALEARVAGPTPEAELKSAAQMSEAEILAAVTAGAADEAAP